MDPRRWQLAMARGSQSRPRPIDWRMVLVSWLVALLALLLAS